jgi:O-antigen/teichoic acid export membrane protein
MVVGVTAGSLDDQTALAVALLYLSIVPSSFTEALNAALNGFERMDAAAWLNISVNLVRAPLAVLLASTRLEVVGIALAAVLGAVFSAELFRRLYDATISQPIHWRLDVEGARALVRESWPLLVNALLISLFFRLDVFVVQAFKGDRELGLYDAAYKLVNLVTIVPAYVTLAIFPAMAARSANRDELLRLQRAASLALVWIAWAVVTAGSAGAGYAIRLLAGAEYLPEAATLLRILVWFAPLSFFNGVVQFVLVAAGLQRRIVPAFCGAVAANLGLNLLLVPSFGARGAAIATVVTEVVIVLAFVMLTRRTTVPAATPRVLIALWRPTVVGLVSTAVALTAAMWLGEHVAFPAAMLTFVAFGVAAGLSGEEERALVRAVMQRRLPATTA